MRKKKRRSAAAAASAAPPARGVLREAYEGGTVMYIGPDAQHNGHLEDPRKRGQKAKHATNPPGVATGRLPQGRAVRTSPAIADVCAQHPKQFEVRDRDGKLVKG